MMDVQILTQGRENFKDGFFASPLRCPPVLQPWYVVVVPLLAPKKTHTLLFFWFYMKLGLGITLFCFAL